MSFSTKKDINKSFDNSKVPSITHLTLGSLKAFKSALSPRIRPRAPSIIDLPDPVSPVITLNPFKKSISNSSINA